MLIQILLDNAGLILLGGFALYLLFLEYKSIP